MSNFTKIIRLDERFPVTGEPTIQILTRADLSRVKIASEAGDFIKSVTPVPDKTIVLVLAMSASEYWGPNRNGDAFAERPVPGMVEKGETLPDHYKTFETNAHVYRHHINKDPAKSMGKVVKAFYNWEMHRVELLLELDNKLAEDVVTRINNGEYPAVSMGCRIKYDCCNLCGNKAPTRAQYCDHAKYEMNRTYPDGRKSFVWNPSPQLFDISWVFRPADRIGFMMKKVAHEELALSAELGEKVADIQEKLSTLNKLSEIDKIIRGQAVDHNPKNQALQSFCDTSLPQIMQHSPGLDGNAIKDLSSVPLPEAVSTLASMGITPTCVEITRIMINRAAPGSDLSPGVADQMGNVSNGAIELFKMHPEVLESVLHSGLVDLDANKVNPALAQKMAGWMEKRSNWKEYLWRRVSVDEPHPEQGIWETVPYQDKATGHAGVTTRGAISAADDASVERQVKMLAGAGLLSGAAYKVLSAHQGGRHLAPLAAAATAMGGLTAAHKYRTPRIGDTKTPFTSDVVTGEKWEGGMPVTTEMKMGSATMEAALPVVSSAAVTAMLAQEYRKRMEAGQLNDARPLQHTMNNVGQMAYRHPAATFLAGLAGIGLGANAAHNMQRFIKHGSEDGVSLPEVDLDSLCTWLGEGLFALNDPK